MNSENEASKHSAAARESAFNGKNRSPLKGLKVLLLEDTDDARYLFTRMLEIAGAETLACRNASAAREALERFQPDVIVSDLGLPEEDGLSFISRFRAEQSDGEHIPAIAITAYIGDACREAAFAAGFDFFLLKPLSRQDLVGTIDAILSPVTH